MTDNMTPQLTLDPTAAAAEAVPTLTKFLARLVFFCPIGNG